MFRTSLKSLICACSFVLSATGLAYGPRPPLEAARADPFQRTLAEPARVKAVKPAAPPAIATPVATPLPTAPDLNLIYAGRMTDSMGREQVFVLQNEQLLVLQAGAVLPNGYKVTSIESNVVLFLYPPLNTTARLNLPAPSKFEIR